MPWNGWALAKFYDDIHLAIFPSALNMWQIYSHFRFPGEKWCDLRRRLLFYANEVSPSKEDGHFHCSHLTLNPKICVSTQTVPTGSNSYSTPSAWNSEWGRCVWLRLGEEEEQKKPPHSQTDRPHTSGRQKHGRSEIGWPHARTTTLRKKGVRKFCIKSCVNRTREKPNIIKTDNLWPVFFKVYLHPMIMTVMRHVLTSPHNVTMYIVRTYNKKCKEVSIVTWMAFFSLAPSEFTPFLLDLINSKVLNCIGAIGGPILVHVMLHYQAINGVNQQSEITRLHQSGWWKMSSGAFLNIMHMARSQRNYLWFPDFLRIRSTCGLSTCLKSFRDVFQSASLSS